MYYSTCIKEMKKNNNQFSMALPSPDFLFSEPIFTLYFYVT
jgi:hypothetical protein